MTSSEETQARSRRGLFWLVLALLVVASAYSAGWFWLAHEVRARADGFVAGLAKNGIAAGCQNMQVAGYPLRFAVTCDTVAYQDDARNIAASAGDMNASASLFEPLWPTAEIGGPLRTSAPGMVPLWIDWDRLTASTSLWWPHPTSVSLAFEGLSGQTDPADDSDPVSLFSTGSGTAELRAEGQDVDASASLYDLEVDAEAIGGRAIPALDVNGGVTLKNGVALLDAAPKSLRGQSIEITNLDVSSGDAHVVLSGPVTVDADGLIDAKLKIKLKNPNAVADVLASAIPERADQIKQGFGALAMFGNAPSMPLTVVKGKASLGFIPLGTIKPVQ